jgi:hypothetical protein
MLMVFLSLAAILAVIILAKRPAHQHPIVNRCSDYLRRFWLPVSLFRDRWR